MTDKEEKNWNPLDEPLFAIYQCPDCGRTNTSLFPAKMKVRPPFFISCDCGSYVMFQGAWRSDKHKPSDLWMRMLTGCKNLPYILEKECEYVGHKLDPDGTMMNLAETMTPEDWERMQDSIKKNIDSRNKMYA